MLYEDISMGKHDNELNEVIEAANTRHRFLNRIKSLSVPVGSKVRIVGISPKKLNGLTGIYVAREGSRHRIELELSQAQKWVLSRYVHGDKNEITVPAGTFEPA